MAQANKSYPVLGWREWASLPDIGINLIECKVDTGARTSALHAYYVEPFDKNGIRYVRFGIHPNQGDTATEQHCEAEVLDRRVVSDSGGHKEERYVIRTSIILGKHNWPIEITLTNRDTMRFRMLLGRTAIAENFVVDSGAKRLAGKPSKNALPLSVLGIRHDEEE